MVKAVLFDMDGVVADTTKLDFEVWQRIFLDFGKKLSLKGYKALFGMKAREVAKKLVNPKFSNEEAQAIETKKEHDVATAIKTHGLKPMPGLKDFLDGLLENNYKIALATAATKERAAAVLKELKLEDYFQEIVTADDVTRGKPSPDIFLKAAEKLNCPSKDCLVIEDAPNGINAARAAGMKVIAIATTHKRHELQAADKVISTFSELTIGELEAL